MSLTITNLQKKIDQQPVLEAVTFSLDRGQVVGLVGPNGIGKTTIFRTITHQYIADGGTVKVDDQIWQPNRPSEKPFFIWTSSICFSANIHWLKLPPTTHCCIPTLTKPRFCT